jgi:hypothetical protein
MYGVEVVAIDLEKSIVRIRNGGTESDLTFEVPKPSAGGAPAASTACGAHGERCASGCHGSTDDCVFVRIARRSDDAWGRERIRGQHRCGFHVWSVVVRSQFVWRESGDSDDRRCG